MTEVLAPDIYGAHCCIHTVSYDCMHVFF
jgi:hypothetical protein